MSCNKLLGNQMESISIQDIYYLLALSASEESLLVEIIWEFDRWSVDKNSVTKALIELVEDDTIALTKPRGDEFDDLRKSEALSIVSLWDNLNRKDIMIFLTKSGEKRWETDDWGISTARARHLMFSNNGTIARIKG